jgi:hypothetical protein
MNDVWIDSALKLVAAVAAGAGAYFLFTLLVNQIRGKSQAESLRAYYRQRGRADDPVAANPGKLQISELSKTRLAFLRFGMDVSGKEEVATYSLMALIGVPGILIFNAFHLGWPISIAGGMVLAYAITHGFVNAQWEKVRLEIEKEIPTFLRNLSGILKAEPNILEALSSSREALDPEKPLAAWVETFITRIQRQGRTAFESLLIEANGISSSLALVVFEVQRMGETGGAGYTAAFHETAKNLNEILNVKGQAAAVASGKKNIALAIIGAAVFGLGYILSAPVGTSVYLENPLFKIGLVAAIAWGAYGWSYIQQMIREATT